MLHAEGLESGPVDAGVECALDSKVAGAILDNGPLQAAADSVFFFCPIILGDEGGEGVAEVLDGHIGKGIDLDPDGEGGDLPDGISEDGASPEEPADLGGRSRHMLRCQCRRRIGR